MRKALGRGLDSLIKQTIKDVSVENTTQETAQPIISKTENVQTEIKVGEIQNISVNKIIANRFQPRQNFNQESLKELAESIKKHGIVQPIGVTYDAGLDKYEIILGERRFRASKLAGLTEVKAIIHKSIDDKEKCALALIENIQREDLSPIETANGYKNLINQFGVMQKELSEYCNKSSSSISNTLRLLELEPYIQKAINKGSLSEGHGRALLMVPAGFREHIFLKARDRQLSVRQTEELARHALTPKLKVKPKKSVDILDFENSLQELLGNKVEIKSGKKKGCGKLILHYSSYDDLEKMTDRLRNN
ncbi:MAG: ParB/RepB/Spo0J family partition protein [Elusimicrobiaceae bacterium]|jgi:ParB family transcriptional regulator, chromosome partitioning protein|nr:ParB/RepB/Spo0J family partition protein [Elusimicrobiaceae bacterium]MBT4008707.1 ParB/RepB/Spo0J family partition protein [Elusimicrobiaceae bacterium]MBT6715018.1 ParB/RepB/Spo0J family partition protein [Elusimicrobiaceae bacterium]